jgi:hypothetical protein
LQSLHHVHDVVDDLLLRLPGVWVALRAPRARGSCRCHGAWVMVADAGANGTVPSLVSAGIGAGVIPLCGLPCVWGRCCPGATPPGLHLYILVAPLGRVVPKQAGIFSLVLSLRSALSSASAWPGFLGFPEPHPLFPVVRLLFTAVSA